MNGTSHRDRRHIGRWLIAGVVIGAGALGAASPASAATVASFNAGVLSVTGDAASNTITISRNAAGAILVNNGAIPVVGGSPTVANTAVIRVFGLAGGDAISLNEANGALPPADLFGGAGADTLTGGAGGDRIAGQAGSDTLLGRGGADLLSGGVGTDNLAGGDGDDQVFGQGGNDRMVWNPGDDTDLNEGGDDSDTVEVNGGNGAEQFTTTANGARVRFDRVTPAPFAIDIGTSESLVVNANGGSDTFAATGNLAALLGITVDGGADSDTLNGSNGADLLVGGDGDDVVDGNQGSDVVQLGGGTDRFQWDPGDGSDVIEGQAGTDTMLFNGSNTSEILEASANGGRVRFVRNVANVVMDLDDVERIDVKAQGSADAIVVNDLTGTDVTDVLADLAALGGGDDAAPDDVIVSSTNDDDVATVNGTGPSAEVTGLRARVSVTGAISPSDRVTVLGLDGDDVIDASALAADSAVLTLNGGSGDDVLIGGNGGDAIMGEDGDDVLIGGPGLDLYDGGTGNNIIIDSTAFDSVANATQASSAWLRAHIRTTGGRTVLDVGDHRVRLANAISRAG